MRIANERRRKNRIGMTGGAWLIEAGVQQEATLRNLSGGGVAVRTQREPRRGEEVQVMLSLDGRTWLDLKGVVRHVQRVEDAYECGIDLRRSDASALGTLDAYASKAGAAIAMKKQSRVFANRWRDPEPEQPSPDGPQPVTAARRPSSGQHRLVRDATGRLVTPEQKKRARIEAAAAAADTREISLQPTADARRSSTRKQSEPTTKPPSRGRSPVTAAGERELARLYRAAIRELGGDGGKKKTK